MWISTFYDAHITALFADYLRVDVLPFSAFSDASPRKLVFQENGTRTIYVSSQLGSVLNQLFSVSIMFLGALASIRIIKHIVATPVSDIASKNVHPYAPLITLFYLIFLPFVVLLLLAVISYGPPNLGLIFFILFICLLSISVLITGRLWPGFLMLLVISLIFYVATSINLLYLIKLLFSFKLSFDTVSQMLLFYVVYPLFYILGKGIAFAFSTDRTFKLYLMHVYDVTILLWVVQWLVNPYPAILAWERNRLFEMTISFSLGVFSFIFQNILAVTILIILTFVMFVLFHFFIQTRDISLWLLSLPGLPQSLSLTSRYIRGLAWLLPAVPFVLNRELVARGELCASAERGVVKVRIHPEDCCDPVEGVVVGCTIDKIAVDNGRERRVFSWGDVRQIELVG